MGTMATGVRINTSQGMILYRECVIQQDGEGWIACVEGLDEVICRSPSMFACIDAVENWHDNRAEAAYQERQERLMESGGPDDSAYRRDMINAGRGHLIRGA